MEIEMEMANCLPALATLAASQERVAYLCARASKRTKRTSPGELGEGKGVPHNRGWGREVATLIQLLTVSILMRLSSVLHKKRQEKCETK